MDECKTTIRLKSGHNDSEMPGRFVTFRCLVLARYTNNGAGKRKEWRS